MPYKDILYSWEYKDFVKWYKSAYGADAPIPPNDANLMTLPIWKRYIEDKGEIQPAWVSEEALQKEKADIDNMLSAYTPPEGTTSPTPLAPGLTFETIDGRQAWVQRDPTTGKIINVQDVGGVEETGLTEFQKATLGFQEKEHEWRVSEAALSREESAREARRQSEEARLGRQRLTQEDIQRELAARTGPADWITRWELIHGVMPRTQIGALQQNQFALLEEANTLSGAERLWKEYQSARLGLEWQNLLAKTAGVPAAPSFYGTNTKDWTPEMFQQAQVWEEALNQAQGQQPKTPPTPEWLPQFAPGQTVGKPITKERMVTPSGQQWAKTPWSVREGLRGYTEFAGYEPYADILEKMAMMAPETPYVTGRWKPSMQRA